MTRKIVFAEHANMEALHEYSQQILAVLGIQNAFVSDLTALEDFRPEQNQLDSISELVGFEVTITDYLVDICTRWRNRIDISIA